MKKTAEWKKQVFLLVLVSIFFFFLGNWGLSLTNPDEVFYVDSAKEMAEHHSWLTPYIFDQPQFEKPIFTYWLLRLAFLLFGIGSFSARLFPGIFALIGVISVYLLAASGFGDRKKGFLCALILGSSALYLGLARTVFTDLIFSVFVLLSLTAFYWGYSGNKKKAGIILFFVFSALGVLTKGPLGILIPGLTALLFLLWRRELKFILCPATLWGMAVFTAIAAPWYVFMLKNYDGGFIREFWVNDHLRRIFEAEHRHNDRWYFYPASMLGCMYPWSLYAAAGLWAVLRRLKSKAAAFDRFLVCWLAVVFLIFQPAHSKLISYIFPLFPMLAIIAGDFFSENLLVRRTRLGGILGLVTALTLLVIPVAVRVAAVKYPVYFVSSRETTIIVFIGWAFALVSLFLALVKKPWPAFLVQAGLLPALLICAPLTNIGPQVSSRQAADLLVRQPLNNSVVLCSKAFVRGVRFYTGARTAVFDSGSDNFFSPHPIPFLNSEQKLLDFLATQPVTYCVLKKSAIDDLERLAGGGYRVTQLDLAGNEYILKVERIK